jgi:malic enzyme
VAARQVTDEMMSAAADALSSMSPAARSGPGASLLPPISEGRAIARVVARSVAMQAIDDGVAQTGDVPPGRVADWVDSRIVELSWEPVYRPAPG